MFLVCGEALMDVFAVDETPTGVRLDARSGGSPFNVAIAIARLAQPVGVFGALSNDFLGERLMRALAEEGVDTRAIVRAAAPTTLSLVGMDAAGVPSYLRGRRRRPAAPEFGVAGHRRVPTRAARRFLRHGRRAECDDAARADRA